MANQSSSSSSSRRTKHSSASSAKDASLGKKVTIDPRVRIHTLKAARETADFKDENNNTAVPSDSSASTPTSTFPSNSSRPNWKRVPLKRCTPHSLLVKPCGPGQIIMPSVPRRKRPTKPNGDDDDDGDATDKEPDSETTEPQLLPTPTSMPPPATRPFVAPPAPQRISDMDVGQTMSAHPPHPETPISEDMNNPSGGSMASNAARPTLPAPPSGTTDGPGGTVSITPNGVAATTSNTHHSSCAPPCSLEYPIAQPADSSSQAPQPTFHPIAHSGDLSQAPHLIVDVSTVNHDSDHIAGTHSQGTDGWLAHQQYPETRHCDLGARSIMDIDQDMGESLETPAYDSRVPTLTAATQPPQSEVLHPTFNMQINHVSDVSQQVSPPLVVGPPQLTQPVHFHYPSDAWGQHPNCFNLSSNQNQLNISFSSASSNQFGSLEATQGMYTNHTASVYPIVGSMPTASYLQPTEPFFEPQHPVQFSASAPAPYPSCSGMGEVQQPAFHPHASYPLPTFPVHQELLPAQTQSVTHNYSHISQNASAFSQFIRSARRTPKPVQQKTSIVLEDGEEWARRVAEVRRPMRVNPFQSSFRGDGPTLIPHPDDGLETRAYRPFPSRMGRKSRPPVGSEEDLVARLALQRQHEAEQAQRALRREKRKQRAEREIEDEIPVKKQKTRDKPTVTRKERVLRKPQPIVQPPAAKPKPLARTRSCLGISKLMKAALRL